MISELEAQELLESKNLITIGMKADEVRRRLHGARTTFVRVFEIHVDAPVATLPPRTSAGEFRIVGTPASLDVAIDAVRSAKALAGDCAVDRFFTLGSRHARRGALRSPTRAAICETPGSTPSPRCRSTRC